MSDDKKLTLSSKTLGVGGGGDSGKVRQNFSQGRSKSVVVEHKKKRVLKKGPAGAETPTPQTQSFTIKKTERPSDDGSGAPSTGSDDSGLTSREQENRAKVLEVAKKRQLEESERVAEESAAKAAREAEELASRSAEDQAADKAAQAAKRSHDDEAARKEQAEEAKRTDAEAAEAAKREEEIRKKTDLEARAVQMRKAQEAGTADATDERGRRKVKGKDDKKKPVRAKAGRDDNRRRGRLTVNAALEGREGRTRSLAAYKRAQAKQRRQESGEQNVGPKKIREVVVPEVITVQELANRMAEKSTEVIKVLMNMGVMATINENLDHDTAELVVGEFGHKSKLVSESDVEIGLFGDDDGDENTVPRAPVVTVMGHVDHGKTSLLDAFRKTTVVTGEAGGITQHIGAYQVKMSDGNRISFLDTPGHAAFTEMRARGASVTDIVILVVAADDSIMPQTIEAIAHAKAAQVPIIVAINKCDLPAADPDKVRQELLQHEVIVEEFQGETQAIEVSAATGDGLDKLQEAIALQAEILELKANPDRAAEGSVVEAKLDKGRGPVATVLVQRGTLRIGDIFVAGGEWGKVRALINDQGEQVDEAGPSVPVEVLGLNGTPAAGDDFAVVDSEGRAREISEYRQGQALKKRVGVGPRTLETLFTNLRESERAEFPIVLKSDVQGSAEAIVAALTKLGNDDIRVRILHSAVGGITESDITLANASEALVIGFNVRPNKQARESAEQLGVTLKFYSVIYNLVDEVKAGMAGQLGPEIQETVIGRADILDAFNAGKGKAAGCRVIDGNIRRDAHARILRDDVIIYNGAIGNLRRFKDDVDTVQSGQECGMSFENYNDFRAGDVMEVYETKEVERQL